MGSRVEFRGYVPEEAIPDLFRTTSVVVMPYDSATGSSGPAHQACEYGVPIVCADIADFRGMAADEDMAVSFYQVGDAADLANQLIGILQSSEQQRQMAEQNFSAAIQMTMPSVVRNYLRWFELNRRKKEVASSRLFPRELPFWRRFGLSRLGALLRAELSGGGGSDNGHERSDLSEAALDLSNPQGWQRSETGD
jgi:glycosyltransferase involved in cell wall biosynthesis